MPARADNASRLQRFARLLAPRCRVLRDEVADALGKRGSPLGQAVRDWGPDEHSPVRLADSFAQTVVLALLHARGNRARPLTLDSAGRVLRDGHSLFRRALEALAEATARADVASTLEWLIRAISGLPAAALRGPPDPWHAFYEHFLAVYDPQLRNAAGAYYTPNEVVGCQVRLVDDLLTRRLKRPLGFADEGVLTLDPAAGTGNYLLGVIDHALEESKTRLGAAAIAERATALARNLYGLEVMAAPLAVARLRVSRALQDRRAMLPPEGIQLEQADTLERGDGPPHSHADQTGVFVCLGNPPYDRHAVGGENGRARAGGWVRWGERGDGAAALMNDFSAPAKAAGHGGHLKNACNLYIYFWRWALWKALECRRGPGVVCFVSASSFLDGHACCGMRELMRRLCDDIWVLDLGGEGRGTRRSENVFGVQTPVAVTLAVRSGDASGDAPAAVRYARIEGTREEKLRALDAVASVASLAWRDCPRGWHAPFRPAGAGAYFQWPLLTDLFPWQHSGAQFKRTWPIGPHAETLRRRWRALLADPDRRAAFKETRDRKVDRDCAPLPGRRREPSLAELTPDAPAPRVVRYAYRSLDRQWMLADARLGDFLRPALWAAHGQRQIYLTTLLNHPLGGGPALTAAADIPDLHHFRGSYGAKEVVPLYRDAAAQQANILPRLLDVLGRTYGRPVSPEQFLCYVYGLLAQPAMTWRFADELGTRELRVPLTKDAGLFGRVCETGARLVWLHTYAQRMAPGDGERGQVPQGGARCRRPVPSAATDYPATHRYEGATQTLHVGGGRFAPVAPEVYRFEVSGLQVIPSWLGYRMKHPKGKKSSPLDAIQPERWPRAYTIELLELLWVLEATLARYPVQAELLSAVVESRCFAAGELPPVPAASRKAPHVRT